jgi:hypothetical protein
MATDYISINNQPLWIYGDKIVILRATAPTTCFIERFSKRTLTLRKFSNPLAESLNPSWQLLLVVQALAGCLLLKRFTFL